MDGRNQKIIDAVIKKANIVCPGCLAIIGIYGSFMTGDINKKSDLDLLILINDDRGWQLGDGFVQEDLQVGHDIYCTTWDSLRNDALYTHPNISKLMDSDIVYCADDTYRKELDALRKQANDIMSAPFSEKDYQKAENQLKEATHSYALAMTSEKPSDALYHTGNAIFFLENAIAMLNKQYFRRGVKRIYEELDAMPNRPKRLTQLLENVVSADNLWGTYEEMFSNWRNKMYLAANTDNYHLAFASMTSLQSMLYEIRENVDIAEYDAMSRYDAGDLYKTAEGFDAVLEEYLVEYRKAEIPVRRYEDIEAFVQNYNKIGEA